MQKIYENSKPEKITLCRNDQNPGGGNNSTLRSRWFLFIEGVSMSIKLSLFKTSLNYNYMGNSNVICF